MMGTSRKRQQREDYKRKQEALMTTGGDRHGHIELPKKKLYRQRAHANPFSDHALTYPSMPQDMDWTKHYPAFTKIDPISGDRVMARQVEIADIGCGFGGLIVALSSLFPETLLLGMELRTQVTDYVINRVAALRSQHAQNGARDEDKVDGALDPVETTAPIGTVSATPYTLPVASDAPGAYQNISALRSNTMKFLPNYFARAQLTKIFLCFPDPHFKQRKHKARIVSAQLNAEYAHVLRPGGLVYTITDVEELHLWMVKHFVGEEAGDAAELWNRVPEDDLQGDMCVKIMSEETEESKKVTRNGGRKFVAVFKRRINPPWPS